tara:strand:- start:141 stop:413 length:273 start_codon:yes stop_codon:yes gene_type:complete
MKGEHMVLGTQEIVSFVHCKECVMELKTKGISPREYAKLECGFTPTGFQVWCQRHNKNVIIFDLNPETESVEAVGQVIAEAQKGSCDTHE